MSPKITSLAQLQSAMGLACANTAANGGNATGGNPGFACKANSPLSCQAPSSTQRSIPQCVVFTPPTGNRNASSPNAAFVAMTFARGENSESSKYEQGP